MNDNPYWSDEARYRYQERLGMLCGSSEPTKEQEAIARMEADKWHFANLNSKQTTKRKTTK